MKSYCREKELKGRLWERSKAAFRQDGKLNELNANVNVPHVCREQVNAPAAQVYLD
ncbi:13360_t:CDS:2, partial [Acaulospora morrowiae]